MDIDTQRLFEVIHNNLERFNTIEFVSSDPIAIPHRYTKKQDIEISGFWTAMLSWGQRVTILKKADELFSLMDYAPYDFILNHQDKDRERLISFKHRTFQPEDTLYFLDFLQDYYKKENSLEQAFTRFLSPIDNNVEAGLVGFHELFFSLPYVPQRTKKHVATPTRGSTCKRLNMFLRWMVRQDQKGVDFGIWKDIKPSQLLIPLDVHVDRIARRYGLITRSKRDWRTVVELTDLLKQFDPEDPAKYDFALFGLGVLESHQDNALFWK